MFEALCLRPRSTASGGMDEGPLSTISAPGSLSSIAELYVQERRRNVEDRKKRSLLGRAASRKTIEALRRPGDQKKARSSFSTKSLQIFHNYQSLTLHPHPSSTAKIPQIRPHRRAEIRLQPQHTLPASAPPRRLPKIHAGGGNSATAPHHAAPANRIISR